MEDKQIDWDKFKMKTRHSKIQEQQDKVTACLCYAGIAIQKERIIEETGLTFGQTTRALRELKRQKRLLIVRVGVKRRYEGAVGKRHIYYGLR